LIYKIMREINIPPEALKKIFEKITKVLPHVIENAENYIADQAYGMWRDMAKTAMRNKSGSFSKWGERYADAIKIELSKSGSGARVYADEDDGNKRYIDLIENGVKAWSIKEALLAGKAAKRNEMLYGTVFVRVPFRWRTPEKAEASTKGKFTGTLPKEVFEEFKSLNKIGKRLGAEFGRMAGLTKLGGPLHSQYMTFRTVSEKSTGWLYPSKSGVPVFETVKKKIEAMIEDAIERIIEGFIQDLQQEGV